MSVNNRFIAIDWNKVNELPETDDEFWGISTEAKDNNETWLYDVPFGEEGEIFEYFTGLMEFLEWFQEARDKMDPKVVADFSSVFTDVGILYGDDDFAPTPIKKDVDLDWVTGAIPPADVRGILQRIKAINLEETKNAFDAATEDEPCEMCENGEAIVAWIKAVERGFEAVSKEGHGILLVVCA